MKTIILVTSLLIINIAHAQTKPAEDCPPEEAKILNEENLKLAQNARRTALKILCKSKFSKRKWKRLLKKIDVNNLSEEDKFTYLLMFAKPGGYVDSDHYSIFSQILQDHKFVQKYRKEILFARQQEKVGSVYGNTIDYLLEAHHEEFHTYDDTESCQTEKERKKTRNTAFLKAYESVKYSGVESALCNEPREVYALIPSLMNLDETQKSEIINPIYRGFGACIANTWQSYEGIPISKALIFTKSYVKSLFGKEASLITDLNPAKELWDGKKGVLTISNMPIITKTGSSTKVLGVYIDRTNDLGESHTWETGYKKFTAKVYQNSIKLGEYIEKGKTPPYKEMLADKELTGIALVSPNLGTRWKNKVTENYLAYYIEQGFDFADPIDFPDSKDWIKENISNGKIDYILKEAHTEGNTSDLMGIAKEHKIMTGVKKRDDGTKEVMHILMPQDGEDVRISFTDMNEWMAKRQEDKKGHIMFLNSSCWSIEQASNEIAQIKSPLFVDIASTSKTTTFYNGKKSTKYHIIDGIRNSRSYAQMQEDMAKTPRHIKGYNQFLFPDSEEYLSILKADSVITTMSFDIKDSEGKPYALHQALE